MVTDASLTDRLRSARDGDQSAWDSLVEEFSPLVWGVIRSFRLGQSDAADAHATTWLRLLDHIAHIREPERLAGWLCRTASNEAISLIRRRARIQVVEPDWFDAERSADASPEGQFVDMEQVRLLRRAVGELDEACRQLLRLLYTEPRLSYAEIAEILQRPIGYIGPTRQRCLKKLRRTCEDAEIGERRA